MGDLASVQVAIGHPWLDPDLRLDGPKETEYFVEPEFASGTSTVIGYQKLLYLPEIEGRTRLLRVEVANRERLLYSIVKMEGFGLYEVEDTVDIRVDGTHAIIRGGNLAVLDFLSLKLRSYPPRTATPQ